MLALELTHNDGQVTLRRAGWQLWDWPRGGKPSIWLIRAECGCAIVAGRMEACSVHGVVRGYRVVQFATDGLPLDLQENRPGVNSIQAKS